MSRYLVHYSMFGELLVDAASEAEAKVAVRRALHDPSFKAEINSLSARNLDEIRVVE